MVYGLAVQTTAIVMSGRCLQFLLEQERLMYMDGLTNHVSFAGSDTLSGSPVIRWSVWRHKQLLTARMIGDSSSN